MDIKSIIEKTIPSIYDYIENKSLTLFILLNNKGIIIDCNKRILSLLGVKEKPIGENIKNFWAAPYKEEINFKDNSKKEIDVVFTTPYKGEIIFKGFVIPYNRFFLLIFDENKLTYNELIVKMSILNNEIVNITKELANKNTQLSEAIKTIKKISLTDHLTGLPNRRAIEKAFKKELSYSKRHKIPLSVSMIDIDYFKKINDTYGHDIGDKVLKKVASIIRKNIRCEDIVGRFGGEEFILILPNTSLLSAKVVLERLRKNIEQMKLRKIKHLISISAGITEVNQEDDTNYNKKSR